jgi:hypothetical protein
LRRRRRSAQQYPKDQPELEEGGRLGLQSFNRCPERSGHANVQPDQRDDYLAAFADLVRRARRAPGCLDVAVTADVLDPGRVYVYERWESWPHLSAWREVASAPDVDIEVTDADIAMWDAAGQRSPFDQAPPEPDAR